jgi:hypothetical protein
MVRSFPWALAALVWVGGLAAQASSSALRIIQVTPAEIVAGAQATLKISGEGFAPGAYVSFSSPGLRVVSTRRLSATVLEATVQAGALAQPGKTQLYVSDPDGASAETAFAILATGPPPQASAPSPAAPTHLASEIRSRSAGSPSISIVRPAQAAPGQQLKIKVLGKNFAKGARVAFSNPGILVDATQFVKTRELSASVHVATNAAAGSGSLFVVNPDGTEAEVPFAVYASLSANRGTAKSAISERFNVLNLGDAVSFLQSGGKKSGVLIVSGNKLEYDEGTKKVFTATASQVQEIAPNQFFGINTGTFHIILTSGKTYNFIASSLTPSATQTIVDSLQKAFRLAPP